MIAELILLLAGHRSALFLESGKLNPAFEELLHPGEQQSLEYLSRIASRYRTLKSSIETLSGTSEYLSSMMAAVRVVLSEYENLVVRTEAKVLQRDNDIVASGSFVPLASLKATFSEWDGPLAALDSLIHHIQRLGAANISPGPLIDLLLERSRTGVERISEIMADLGLAVQRVWQMHLTAYLVHGALTTKDPFATANPHQLSAHIIPNCISPDSRDSIAYVGRAIATVKAARGHRYQQQQLPRSLAVMHTKMLSKVLPQDRHTFDAVLAQIRVNVSEWLWATVLTRKDVDDALDSLANYFLLRNGEFSVALIREIERLKLSRLTPRASSRTPGISIIREQDLSLALLRASLGTSAQHDPTLSRLRFTLPTGPVRPLIPSFNANPDLSTLSVRSTSPTVDFRTTLLGTPLELNYALAWPLDLFLTPSDLRSYTHLFAYFSSIRHTHQRVMACWSSLSNSQRKRRRWVGLGEGGDAHDGGERRDLLRCGWGVVREMVWFLDALWAYICLDVVEGQYQGLKALLTPPGANSGGRKRASSGVGGNLAPGGASVTEGKNEAGGRLSHASTVPSVPRNVPSFAEDARPTAAASSLDFATLRSLHSAYLYALNAGSLLSNPNLAGMIKTIMELCEVFVATVERWGGDVLPDLLAEGSISGGEDSGVGRLVRERVKVVRDINETLNSFLETFYEDLSASLSPQSALGNGDTTAATTFLAAGPSQNPGATMAGGKRKTKETNILATDAEVRRGAERLLLRLDFNNGFSKSSGVSRGGSGGILKEGGLA